MADRKLTNSTAMEAGSVDLINDQMMIVDVSDTTDALSGTTKKITPTAIKTALSVMSASDVATLTNKTFDANGTGNSISNIEAADIASSAKTGNDSRLVTGTAGTDGNLAKWNTDGDLVDAAITAADVVTGSSTNTFTNKTFDANGTGNSISNIEIADIASSSKSGADVTLITGTEGTANNLSMWNADGDLVDASLAVSSVVTASTTNTFTNKTFDANGSGNSISNIEVADIAASAKSGADTTLITGTEGTSGNLGMWNIDGDLVDASVAASAIVTASSSTTFTNKTFDANGTGNSISNIEVADIASSAKTGSDTRVCTGTAGTSGNIATWNADGDLVDGSLASNTIVTASSSTTFTNKTIDANGTGNSITNIETADIASGSKTGNDSDLCTGTAGVADNLASWDVDGNVIDSGIAISSIGGGSTPRATYGTLVRDSSNALTEVEQVGGTATPGTSGCALTTSTGSTDVAKIVIPSTSGVTFSLNPHLFIKLQMSAAPTVGQAYFGVHRASGNVIPNDGSAIDLDVTDHMGFFIDYAAGVGSLYAVCSNGTSATQSSAISGVTLTSSNSYAIIKSDTEIKYYVNGVLEETLNSNLPDTDGSTYLAYVGVTNATGTSGFTMTVTGIFGSWDMF